MFSVRAFQAGDAGIETWNLRHNHLKRSALPNRFPGSHWNPTPPPFFPSPIVVQTELHDWAWALVSQILLVEKKLTTEKTTADVCSFFPSPTKTRLQMMSNRGEDEAFGVRAVLHNRRHTQLNFFFFFFVNYLFRIYSRQTSSVNHSLPDKWHHGLERSVYFQLVSWFPILEVELNQHVFCFCFLCFTLIHKVEKSLCGIMKIWTCPFHYFFFFTCSPYKLASSDGLLNPQVCPDRFDC